MRILLSQSAFDRHWEQVAALAPGAGAIRLTTDGKWVGGDPTDATVAWFSDDLYHGGLARPFFGAVVRAPNLQWFQSAAAGHDDPVFQRLRDSGVRVTTAHVNAVPIAEHVVRTVIDHRHGAGRWRAAAAEHRWGPGLHDEVCGTTMTIVGLGSIGRAVAALATALGVDIRGVRRRPSADDPVRSVPPARLFEVLAGADTVVLCPPLTPETKGLAGDRFFSAMSQGSLLVNVGRGGLVDETALVRGLDRGRPSVAALDVFATEPLPPDHPFWDDDRIVITPHVAGSSTGNAVRLADLFCQNLAAFLAGEALQHEVP